MVCIMQEVKITVLFDFIISESALSYMYKILFIICLIFPSSLSYIMYYKIKTEKNLKAEYLVIYLRM